MPHAETAANALPAGSLVLLEVRRRRKKAKVPPATMAYDARPDWLRQGRQPAIVEGIIEELLDAGVDHQIGIGPLVARPNGAVTTTPEVYFAVVGSDEGGLFTLLAGAGDRAGAADLRSAVIARLVAEWPRVTVWAADDELELAEWAVRQWPNDPAATTIVATITAERRGG